MRQGVKMYETTIKIEGMSCSHCEIHIQDTLRKAFNPKKVKASASKKEAVVISEEPISEEAAHKAIDPTGYKMTGIVSKPYVKKGFFGFLKK